MNQAAVETVSGHWFYPRFDAPLPTVKSCLTFDKFRPFEEITTAQEVAIFCFFKSHSGLIGQSHRVFTACSFICAGFRPNWKQARRVV